MTDRHDRTDWLYYRVYVASIPEIRHLVEEVVAPAVGEFTADDPELHWFFLQYVDLVGLQLRLRLRGTPERLAAYERVLDPAFDTALDRLASGAAPVPAPPPGPFPARRAAVKRLYEPEFDKFGGPAGVALAERLMRRGSETALRCSGPRHRAARTAIAAAHTWLVVSRLPEGERTAFLHQYAWYWSGRGLRDAPPGRPLPRLAHDDPAAHRRAAILRAKVAQVLADPVLGPELTAYADGFWQIVHEAGLARPDYLTAFHHIHLMNNRLGAVPGEEMQIARLLWLDRLAAPVPTAGA
ncbi:lantibiotic dehydratase C-terminal domain-containing protein [Streptomyces sp. NPDC002825]|uniref:lantibiotic dehydratase C-terminal domain-containing protein n=1 Tax=Streptomyces sp. NPDC002825 TaxID=3154666 RepID=UPI00331C5BF3